MPRALIYACCLMSAALAAPANARAEARLSDYEDVKAAILALEQAAMDEGRPVPRSPYFLPFPSGWSASASYQLEAAGASQIAFAFVDMAYNGRTAVMMYTAHRTRQADGTPADEHFEVTNTWSSDGTNWLLLSTRAQPVEPPLK